MSGGTFLLLSENLSNAQFLSFGWRIPFLASAILVIIGLYVRLKISETPVFQAALANNGTGSRADVRVFVEQPRALLCWHLESLATFVLFYLMAVFALSWGTTRAAYRRAASSDDATGVHAVFCRGHPDQRPACRARSSPRTHRRNDRHCLFGLVTGGCSVPVSAAPLLALAIGLR